MSKAKLIYNTFGQLILSLAEIVLYTLVSNFKFELTDKPVYWKFAGVIYPATSKERTRPELWLNVSLAS